ncbi:MAG: type II toxin-antitoxin system PemK/MazF family toxin [Patescibacteria group bacterium]|mgnify:CR=1 FL=1
MEEDLIKFVTWTKLKIRLHLKPDEHRVYFSEREIWWSSLGVNIGYEQDGKNDNFERPILILKKFSRDILWALPMTSKNRTGEYYHQFKREGEQYSIILSQLRLISSKRLLRKIGMIAEDEFEIIREKVKKLV